LQRKNMEMIAYLHDQDRQPLQKFIGQVEWGYRPLLGELVRQVGAKLGEADGVLVFDPSAFPKQGRNSVGVARQWCGRLGKTDNCQLGIFMGYVTRKEHALVNFRLFMPKEWSRDKARREKCSGTDRSSTITACRTPLGNAACGVRAGALRGTSHRRMPEARQERGGLGRLRSSHVGRMAPSSNAFVVGELVFDAGENDRRKKRQRTKILTVSFPVFLFPLFPSAYTYFDQLIDTNAKMILCVPCALCG
jgi:hypothetical protein